MPGPAGRLSQFVLIAFLMVQLFFLVDGAAIFPAYWAAQNWNVWLPIYILLTLSALLFSRYVGVLGDPFGMFPLGLVYMMVGFIAAYLLFQIPGLAQPINIPRGQEVPTVAFTFFVVAFGEEMLFRHFLNSYLFLLVKWFAPMLSAGSWALFHWAAYGESFSTLLFIFAIGLIFGYIHLGTRKFGGIGATVGAHAGWNLGTFGALSLFTSVQFIPVAGLVVMLGSQAQRALARAGA